LVVCLPFAASTALGAGEDDPLAWERHQNLPKEPVSSVDWYSPTEAVGEGPGAPLRFAKRDERTLAADALDRAAAYAQSMNSYGLIVAHRGVIQLEVYRGRFRPRPAARLPVAAQAAGCNSDHGSRRRRQAQAR
jgi:hypothetical protein